VQGVRGVVTELHSMYDSLPADLEIQHAGLAQAVGILDLQFRTPAAVQEAMQLNKEFWA
jgi:hypothetical protein